MVSAPPPVSCRARIRQVFKGVYERLGEDIANELVEMCNLTDATYRSDSERSTRSTLPVDAKLEQRVEGLRTELRADIQTSTAQLREVLERRLGEQTRWMFIAWTALLIPLIGLWFR